MLLDLLSRAGIIAIVGMSMVFLFLKILIWAVELNAAFIHKMGWDIEPEPQPVRRPATKKSADQKKITAVISAAVEAYQKGL